MRTFPQLFVNSLFLRHIRYLDTTKFPSSKFAEKKDKGRILMRIIFAVQKSILFRVLYPIFQTSVKLCTQGTCVHKVHTWYVCSLAQLFDKNPQRLCGWWLPNKAVWNAKDLILKFCHSFRDIASPLAPNSRGPKMAHQRTTVERH